MKTFLFASLFGHVLRFWMYEWLVEFYRDIAVTIRCDYYWTCGIMCLFYYPFVIMCVLYVFWPGGFLPRNRIHVP